MQISRHNCSPKHRCKPRDKQQASRNNPVGTYNHLASARRGQGPLSGPAYFYLTSFDKFFDKCCLLSFCLQNIKPKRWGARWKVLASPMYARSSQWGTVMDGSPVSAQDWFWFLYFGKTDPQVRKIVELWHNTACLLLKAEPSIMPRNCALELQVLKEGKETCLWASIMYVYLL